MVKELCATERLYAFHCSTLLCVIHNPLSDYVHLTEENMFFLAIHEFKIQFRYVSLHERRESLLKHLRNTTQVGLESGSRVKCRLYNFTYDQFV